MKVGSIVKSNIPFPKQYVCGVILELKPMAGGKSSAEVYWDDGKIRGIMTKYLEVICK